LIQQNFPKIRPKQREVAQTQSRKLPNQSLKQTGRAHAAVGRFVFRPRFSGWHSFSVGPFRQLSFSLCLKKRRGKTRKKFIGVIEKLPEISF